MLRASHGMMLRRARLFRLLIILLNLIAALVAVGTGLAVMLLRDRPEKRVMPAFPIPEADPLGPQPLKLTVNTVREPPRISRPTAYEDLMVLLDAPRDFAASYRVIFASLDEEPSERRCILQPRKGGEQLVLVAGERLGTWLLLAIDAEVGEPPGGIGGRVAPRPRSVRLRFRDLRRGEDVVAVLAPGT